MAIETILSIALFLGGDTDDFGPIIAQRRKYVSALARSAALAADQAYSGMVAPSAGGVQRQNLRFQRNGSTWVTRGPAMFGEAGNNQVAECISECPVPVTCGVLISSSSDFTGA